MRLRHLSDRIEAYARFNAARTLSSAAPSAFETHRFGDVVAMLDSARPTDAMYNRVLGYGEHASDDLHDILAIYANAGASPHFDIAAEDQSGAVEASLRVVGFEASDPLMYLDAQPARAEATSDVEVRRWAPQHADEFRALLETSGATCADDVWAARRVFYCTDTFRTFVASRDGTACAWGTMFVDGKFGFLANAYTQPAYRDRGCHSALLAARLADAGELGLRRVYTDVELDSASHRNCERAGFRETAVLTIWARPVD